MANPTIASFMPLSVLQFSNVTLVITGQNFTDGCEVLIDGANPDTTFVSSTTLYAHLSAQDTNTVGTRAVSVRCPNSPSSIAPSPLTVGAAASHTWMKGAPIKGELPILGFPALDPQDPAAKATSINQLFGNWGSASQVFQPYILIGCLPDSTDPLSDIAGDAEEQPPGQWVDYCPFPGCSYGIRFQYIDALVADDKSRPVFSPHALNAVYTLTEGFSAPMAYGTAKVLSSAVLIGLTTRLLLQRYSTQWAAAGSTPVSLNLGLTGYGLLNSLTRLSAVQTTPAHWFYNDTMWSTWNPKPDASTSFQTFLSMMMDACSSQATGLVFGWCAGDSILSITDAKVSAQCEGLVWKLLGSRFTTYEIGLVVAYALNYLIGFIKNERTLDIINGTGTPSEDPTLSISDILVRLEKHVDDVQSSDPLVAITDQLFQMAVDEFYAIENDPGLSDSARTAALTQQRAFVLGFQKGSMTAAESVFRDVFRSAYSIGYARGFRDGYSLGYAAGFQAGYAKGFSDGKAVWSGLSGILGSIGTVATDLSGFLKNAATAGTVITGIAALL